MVINTGTYSPYSYYDGYYDGYYHDYIDSDAISIPGLLAVEAFLQIGKFLKRIYRWYVDMDIFKFCVLFQSLLLAVLVVLKHAGHHRVALAYHLNR